MTTTHRPRHRAPRPAPVAVEHHHGWVLTPNVAQAALTVFMIVCAFFAVGQPGSDHFIALGTAVVLWAAHGIAITRMGARK